MKLKPIIYLFLSIISLMSALAIGIGPAQVFRPHHAGSAENLSFTIINDEQKTLDFNISVRGEPILSCPTVPVNTRAATYTLVCALTHPTGLSPGPHYAEVVVSEIKPSGEGLITAIPASVSTVRLEVPRPGTYAEAKMEVNSRDNHVLFSVYVFNFGTSAIEQAYADIKVGGKSITTDTKSVATMSEAKLSAETTLANGSYTATAILQYDSKNRSLEKDFVVGKRHIRIERITIDKFIPGDIARIRVRLSNLWPERIDNVHAELALVKDNRADTITTETFSITDTYEVSGYWNTADKTPGIYNGTITVIYGAETTTGLFGVTVPGPTAKPTYSVLLIGIIIVVIAVLIYLFFRLRKRPRAPQIPEPPSRPRDRDRN